MLDIDIRYRPFKLFLWFRYLKVKLPIHWHELTQKQFIAIPYLQRGLLDDLKIMQIFLGVKRHVAKSIDIDLVTLIKSYLKFIEEPELLDYFVIKKAMWFKAPDPKLNSIGFDSFIWGDKYYQSYLGGIKRDRDRFIACFYYDHKGFGDWLEYNAIIMRMEKERIREAIVVNYSMIRLWLMNLYPSLFRFVDEIGKIGKSNDGFIRALQIFEDYGIIDGETFLKKPLHEALNLLNTLAENAYSDPKKAALLMGALAKRSQN